MTAVAFHTGVADKIGYACRLLRKATRQGARVRVVGDAAELELLDKALWTFEPHDFVPHLRLGPGAAPAPSLHRTPIWLTPDLVPWPSGLEPPEVLVNLGTEPPVDMAGAARVIEIVGDDELERAGGRRRWRQYEVLGFAIQHFPASPG